MSAAIMVDALVNAAAEGIHKKVVSIATNELTLAWGYKKKLDTLQHTLKITCAKLRDVENEKGEDHGVMVWLKILKHLVGEADDLLDDVYYEMLRQEVMMREQTTMIAFRSLPSLKMFSFHREMGQRIENITNKFSEMNKQAKNLGLQNRHPRLVLDGLHRETDSSVDQFKIVGRESDELHIIQLLTQSRKEGLHTIVSIVGMGGIGKSTLAKLVYHNPKTVYQFDVRVWLSVSVKVDVNTLLAKICGSLAGDECKSQFRVNLITNLQKKLGSRRYLIVLDDVRDEELVCWDEFRSCMLKVNSKNGSCFLVTTQNLKIGTKAFSEDFHSLEGLSDDECWSIFKERVFMEGQSLFPELEAVGRDIVKKCRGLPLLAKLIGGMLRNYYDKEKWLAIKDNKAWDLENPEHIVQNILKLCFDNLPNYVVKQCFTYYSIFENDRVNTKEEIIQLWMALGLVLTDESAEKEMEDVGNDIFHVLVNSSLLQAVTRDGFTSCSMHGLVNDLSSSFSKHESICLMHRTGNDIVHIPPVKHLAVYQHLNEPYRFNTNVSTVLHQDMTARTLHTLFFEGKVDDNISFQHFKFMRVLNFSRCKLEKLDDSIGELVYLRYLDLSYTQIKVLPNSIGKLYHLQTLKLIACYGLHILPLEMKNLISLRNFEFPKLFIVTMVGQLTVLRTLPFFGVLRQKGYQIEELGRLKHLRGELHIFSLENITSKEDAIKAGLSEKKNLYKIELVWGIDRGANSSDEDVLDGLQPPGNVKKLTIVNFSGDNFPAWVSKMAINIDEKWTPLHKLVEIILSGCRSCIYLPILENLPLLQKLVLENMDNLTCLSSSLDQGDNIIRSMKPLSLSLRSLKLSGMKKLEKWIDVVPNSSTMLSPVLQELYISFCPKIVLLDESHPHPLVSLELYNCDNLVSIKSIQGLTSLESLAIHTCPSLLGIPDLHNQGYSLKRLSITDCQKLTALPHDIFECLSLLNELKLGPFSKELQSFPSLKGIEKLRNHLHILTLAGWPHLQSIPEEVKHLTSLTVLCIIGYGIHELPMWLTNMSSIRRIHLIGCMGLHREKAIQGAPREAVVRFMGR